MVAATGLSITGSGCRTLAGGTGKWYRDLRGRGAGRTHWTHSRPGIAMEFGAMASEETLLLLDAARGYRVASLFSYPLTPCQHLPIGKPS